MTTVYSEYENLSYILNFRTSNLGLTKLDSTTLSPSEDIFSYIDNDKGVPILNLNTTTSPLTDNLNEKDLMQGLVFNHRISMTNRFDDEYRNSINYLLKTNITTDANKYKIGDFSHNIKRNCLYYKDNFVYTNIFAKNIDGVINGDIKDIDVSYYASQNVIKYLFLLDTLSEFYRLANENKGRKTDVINILSFLKIKCRYFINSSGEWEIYKPAIPTSPYYYEMSFADTLKNNPPIFTVNKITLSDNSSVTIEKSNTMINLFSEIFIRHINYIKKADMMFAGNFSNYFKLCRLMLNYNVVYSIKTLLAFNCLNISIITNTTPPSPPVYNNICDDNIFFNYNKTPSLLPSLSTSISYEKYYNHLMPSCLNNNYKCDYFVDVIGQNELPETKPLGTSKSLLVDTFKNFDIPETVESDNASKSITYRILSTSTSTSTSSPFVSKPIGKVFEYIPSSISQITFELDPINNFITKINNITPNTEYFIKLHNFSTIGPIQTPDNTDFDWDNNSKILKILKKNKSPAILLPDNFKLYLIGISHDSTSTSVSGTSSITESTSIIFPSAFTNSTMSILFTTINSTDTGTTGKLNTAPYSTANNLVTITYPATGSLSVTLAKETGLSRHFYKEGDKLSVLKCMELDDDTVFKLIFDKPDYAKTLNISSNNIANLNISGPSINPVSFEDCTYTFASRPDDFLQYFYLPIITNFKNKVGNVLETDTSDNDNIIKTMSNLSTVNKTITKNSSVIKTNHNQFEKEHTKVLSSSKVDILAIIIFVITILSVILLPYANLDKNTLLISSGSLFVVVLIITVIIYSLIFSNYTEDFTLEEDEISFKTEINSIIAQLLRNLYNERTRISQKVILPSLLKENKYFQEKDRRFKVYNKLSYSDLQIEARNKQNNVARISFLLNLSLILATAFIIYVVVPTLWKVILGVSLVLIIIVIFIYFTQITKVVRTNSHNIYWQKPDTALQSLNFAGNAAAPPLV